MGAGPQRLISPLAEDLDFVLESTSAIWEALRGKRLFMTGGTGFFGAWLLETFAWANRHLQLSAEALVLSRRPEAFTARFPHLACDSAVKWCRGDVRSFKFPSGHFDIVIHAATAASRKLIEEEPGLMFDTIVSGTQRVLGFATQCGARQILLASSGAVYGPQPSDLPQLTEDFSGGPDPADVASVYAEGKRAAEMLCVLAERERGLEAKIARGFAFVGPHLPLDTHYAIGNFIRAAMQGGPICIEGDGTPCRSYLYAADLAVWLWTILFKGQSGRAYNVGSSVAISIRELAETIAGLFSQRPRIVVSQAPVPGKAPERYVPCTRRAETELGLKAAFDLETSILKTLRWHQGRCFP